MVTLYRQCWDLARGTSRQKRRVWNELVLENGLWGGCRQIARAPAPLDELAQAYAELQGPWDRTPIVEAVGGDAGLVAYQVDGACRLLAAAAAAAVARHEPERGDALLAWSWRATGSAPGRSGTLPEPPHGGAQARVRQCFQALAADSNGTPVELGLGQDAVLSLLQPDGGAEQRPYHYTLRVPVLLSRGREGFLAWLRLERLDWGFGQLFQAPSTLLAPLQPDLRLAIQNAWEHVVQRQNPTGDEDVRWCLTHLPQEDGLSLPVRGASLQAAAVVGLTLLLEGWPYDPACAISATVAEDGSLGEVEGVTNNGSPKLEAARRLISEAGQAVVVVSPGNFPSEAERAEWETRGVKLTAAGAVSDVLPVASGLFKQQRPELSPPTGVVPLDSPFYIPRSTDGELAAAIARRDSIIRVKGARQMGKTSLLARGLQQARNAGAQVVLTDFQMLNGSQLQSPEVLLLALARWIARSLQLDVSPQETWDPDQGPSANFREFMLEQVLARATQPVVWGLDEADRLFTCGFGSEVFGLFRSWHNERALYPHLPWNRLTLVISYATEAHLFITDLNQSPFNVGTTIALRDFSLEEVSELNRRYEHPLRGPAEVERYYELLCGHPYLTHRGLYEIVTQGLHLGALESHLDRDEGVFGDHLRRILLLLGKDPVLLEAVRGLLHGQSNLPPEAFYRLRAAGVVSGDSARAARPRCRLYANYLVRHLA